jgi:uncharacterized cupin superfamily protein
MAMDLRSNHFSTEEEAVAEIKAAGFWPITVEFPAEKNENHWHDFDAMVFVLEGEVSISEAETGECCTCGPGTRMSAKAGIVHREDTAGYKAVVGLGVDPTTLTQPINKAPEDL